MGDRQGSADAGSAAIRGGTLRIAGYVVGSLLSVVSAALLFRHLGIGDSGRYVLVLSIATIAVGLTEAGLSAIGVRELVQGDDAGRAGDLVRGLLGLRIVLSAAGTGAACLYVSLAGYGTTAVLGAALAGTALLLHGVQSVLTVVLQAELRFGAVALTELARQVALAVAVVVLVAAGAGLLPFFAALVLGGLGGIAVCVVLLRGRVAWPPGFGRERWRSVPAQVLPLAFATAIAVVYLRVGLLVLEPLTDARQTGLYAVSFRIVEVIGHVPVLVASAALPIFARAARDDPARLRAPVQRVFDGSLLLGLLVAVALVAGAPAVIAVVGGARFEAADDVLRWHALGLCATFAAAPLGYALLAAGRVRFVLAQITTALVVSLAATPLLATAHGAVGAASASAAAEWALVLSGAVLLARGGVRLSLRTPLALLAVGAAGLLPLLLLPPVAAALVGCALVAVLAGVLGLVPREVPRALGLAHRT